MKENIEIALFIILILMLLYFYVKETERAKEEIEILKQIRDKK